MEWVRLHHDLLLNLTSVVVLVFGPFTYYLLAWRRRPFAKEEWFTHFTLLSYMITNSMFNFLGIFNSRLALASSQADSLSIPLVIFRSPILLMFYAMGLILSRRKAETEREKMRLQQELSAAAEVQALLLPGVAGEGVDAVYLPASEVGGDFYQSIEADDGTRIALLGDVSGKGLKAAMLVSVAIGAIQREEEAATPEVILGRLNLALLGRTGGGFVTCCCVRLEKSDRLLVASAGHPAPYWRGQEMEIEAGLPLGVVRDAVYQSQTFQIDPGGTITLVSDGVLEAANAQGELFGFDRTREISVKPAIEIANAAKAWGQNDDITVVTVRRNA